MRARVELVDGSRCTPTLAWPSVPIAKKSGRSPPRRSRRLVDKLKMMDGHATNGRQNKKVETSKMDWSTTRPCFKVYVHRDLERDWTFATAEVLAPEDFLL